MVPRDAPRVLTLKAQHLRIFYRYAIVHLLYFSLSIVARPRTAEIRWSRKLAYAIGLLTTDGNLSPDGRHFDFTSNDKELIDTLKICLSLKNKVARKRSGYTQKKTAFRIQFGNVTLYKWLLRMGLMPNKSKRMGALKIPDRFFFDFLRGHLDGDGSVKKYYDPVYPKSKRLYLTFISASLRHVLWIQKSVKRLITIKGFLRTGRRVYVLTYSKHDSITLLQRLYYKSDVPCLKRKFLIAQEFVSLPRW